MDSSYTQYLSFIDDCHHSVVELITGLKLTKRDPWQRTLVLLYLTQIELFTTMRILIVNNCSAGIYQLLRSLMEANVDFINMLNDKDYVQYIRAAQIAEQIGIMDCSQRGNPFFEGISESPVFEEEYERLKQEQEKLKTQKFTPLLIQDKFKKAGMVAEFWSVYKTLCSETHNNLNALNGRYLRLNPDKRDYKIELFTPIDFDHLLPYLDSMCAVIVSATESIHNILKSVRVGDVTELRNRFQQIRL